MTSLRSKNFFREIRQAGHQNSQNGIKNLWHKKTSQMSKFFSFQKIVDFFDRDKNEKFGNGTEEPKEDKVLIYAAHGVQNWAP